MIFSTALLSELYFGRNDRELTLELLRNMSAFVRVYKIWVKQNGFFLEASKRDFSRILVAS